MAGKMRVLPAATAEAGGDQIDLLAGQFPRCREERRGHGLSPPNIPTRQGKECHARYGDITAPEAAAAHLGRPRPCGTRQPRTSLSGPATAPRNARRCEPLLGRG